MFQISRTFHRLAAFGVLGCLPAFGLAAPEKTSFPLSSFFPAAQKDAEAALTLYPLAQRDLAEARQMLAAIGRDANPAESAFGADYQKFLLADSEMNRISHFLELNNDKTVKWETDKLLNTRLYARMLWNNDRGKALDVMSGACTALIALNDKAFEQARNANPAPAPRP